MEQVELKLSSGYGMNFPKTPRFSFVCPNAITNFAASGSIASGSVPAEFVIAEAVDQASEFDDTDFESSVWWSAEYAARTDKDSSGFVTDWTSMHSSSEGTTVPLSYQKPIWEDNQTNGFPHMRTSSDAFSLDTPISLRANQSWTIAIMCGPRTPSLYGCWLGSTNNSSATILSAYRWAGRRLKLRNDSGDELSIMYDSSLTSQYGGGERGMHILRCDGTDVYMRLNGNDLGSHTPTSGAQYNFDRVFHYKTTSTQQNSHGSIHEFMVFDDFLSGTDLTDLEGMLMSKYDVMTNVPTTHPYYNATATDYYKTPQVDTADNKTTTSLVLSTTETNFSMATTSLSANTTYDVYPMDLGNTSDITIKVQFDNG